MPSPAVTYTFTNSTTADGPQVSTNFSDLIAGMTDGSKDFSINALTCAGAATLNGNVNLGNAVGDDISILGSIAASIPVKTTNTYDFGSATISMRSFYLSDAGSAGRSTRILGATVASSWTLTTPTTAGTAGYFLQTNGSGVTTWAQAYIAANPQSTNYFITVADQTTNVTTSTSTISVQLPTAVGISGKRFTINKVDTGSGKISLVTTSSQLVGGIATGVIIMGTWKDSLTVESDGANYQIIHWDIFLGCRYNSTTAQSMIGGANTVVFFENSEYDKWGLVTNPGTTGFTCTAPIAGKYQINVRTGLASTLWVATDSVDVRLFINNGGTASAVSPIFYSQAAITIGADTQVIATFILAAGDTIIPKISLNHTGNINTSAVARSMYFEFTLIGH